MGDNARALQNAIRAYLTLKGFFCWKGGTGGIRKGQHFWKFGEVGAPDLFALRVRTIDTERGKFLEAQINGIEVKYGKDVVSDEQKAFHVALEKHGGKIIIARSLADVMEAIP